MQTLEGDLTEEKEILVHSEQQKYDDANEQISRINQMQDEGELSELQAENMKMKYEYILSFYPQFEKVLEHYELANKEGIPFLYDTGYRELFWMNGGIKRLQRELLIAAVTIILSFASVFSMEDEKGAWTLIGATRLGKKKIVKSKIGICLVSAMFLSVFGWVSRMLMIGEAYPLRKILFVGQCVRGYNGIDFSLIVLMLLQIMIHIVFYLLLAATVLFISGKRKKTIEVYVYSTMCLVVPMLIFYLL